MSADSDAPEIGPATPIGICGSRPHTQGGPVCRGTVVQQRNKWGSLCVRCLRCGARFSYFPSTETGGALAGARR